MIFSLTILLIPSKTFLVDSIFKEGGSANGWAIVLGIAVFLAVVIVFVILIIVRKHKEIYECICEKKTTGNIQDNQQTSWICCSFLWTKIVIHRCEKCPFPNQRSTNENIIISVFCFNLIHRNLQVFNRLLFF